MKQIINKINFLTLRSLHFFVYSAVNLSGNNGNYCSHI